MSEEKFIQAEWTAQTVNQSVNNYPSLENMNVDQKLNMVIRKLIGDPWSSEPGIVAALHEIRLQQGLTAVQVEKQGAQIMIVFQWGWAGMVMLVIEIAVVVVVLLRVF